MNACSKSRFKSRVAARPSSATEKAFALGLILGGLFSGCTATNTQQDTAKYPYRYPLTSPGEKFGGLPPAAQKTVRAQAGAAELRDIEKVDREGEWVYRVTFENQRLFPPLYVKPDGTVLYPDMAVAVGIGEDETGVMSGGASGLAFSDLPKNVAEAIQKKAPAAEPAHIRRISNGSQVRYEVTFKEKANHPTLLVAEDGAIVE